MRAVRRAAADPMHATVEKTADYAQRKSRKPLDRQRPFIQCEYSHAMGNSSGNFADRKAGAWVRCFFGTVDSLFHRYGDPQESGQRTGIRRVSFTRTGGAGLHFAATGDHLLEFGSYPGLAEDLEIARHPIDLPVRDFVTINLDHRQMGVGGTNFWGELPLKAYQLPASGEYRFSFLLPPTAL